MRSALATASSRLHRRRTGFLDRRRPLRKRKLRADDSKRGSELMAGIAGEVPQRIESRLQADHERVHGIDEPLDFVRHLLADRMQIVGAALGDRIAKPIERPQGKGDGDPDDHRRPGDHQPETQGGTDDDGLRELAPGDRRLRDGDDEGNGIDPVEAERLSAATRIGSPRKTASAKLVD